MLLYLTLIAQVDSNITNYTAELSAVNEFEFQAENETIGLYFEELCYIVIFTNNSGTQAYSDSGLTQKINHQEIVSDIIGYIYIKALNASTYISIGVYQQNDYITLRYCNEDNFTTYFIPHISKLVDYVYDTTEVFTFYPNTRVYTILNLSKKTSIYLNYELSVCRFSIYPFEEIRKGVDFLESTFSNRLMNNLYEYEAGLYQFAFYAKLQTFEGDEYVIIKDQPPNTTNIPANDVFVFNESNSSISNYTTYNLSIIYIPETFEGKLYDHPFHNNFTAPLSPGTFRLLSGTLFYQGPGDYIQTLGLFEDYSLYLGCKCDDDVVALTHSDIANTLIFFVREEAGNYSVMYSGLSEENSDGTYANQLVFYNYTLNGSTNLTLETLYSTNSTYGSELSTSESNVSIIGYLYNSSASTTVTVSNALLYFQFENSTTASRALPGGYITKFSLNKSITEVVVFPGLCVIVLSFSDDYKITYVEEGKSDLVLTQSNPGIYTEVGGIIKIGLKKTTNSSEVWFASMAYESDDCAQFDIVYSSQPYWYVSSTSEERNASALENNKVCAWLLSHSETIYNIEAYISEDSSVYMANASLSYSGYSYSDNSIIPTLNGTYYNVSTAKKPDDNSDLYHRRKVLDNGILDEEVKLQSVFVEVDIVTVTDTESFVKIKAQSETTPSDTKINLVSSSMRIGTDNILELAQNTPQDLPEEPKSFPVYGIVLIVIGIVGVIGSVSGYFIYKIYKKKKQDELDLLM